MTEQVFKKLLNQAIKSKSASEVYYIAEQVANSKNPFYICDFAEMVPLADNANTMELLEDWIISCGDIYHVYEFMFTMVDSGKSFFNVDRFANLLLANPVAKILYYCLECVPGINKARFETALMSTGDTKYIQLYLDNDEIEKVNKPGYLRVQLRQIKQNLKDLDLRNIPDQLEEVSIYAENDDNILQYAIKKSAEVQNPMLINMAAEYTECNRIDAFNAMMASGNILHIYEYYCSVELTQRQKDIIFDYIKNSGYAKIMYYMCKWTDLSLDLCYIMQDAIIKTGNKKYINLVAAAIEEKWTGHGV